MKELIKQFIQTEFLNYQSHSTLNDDDNLLLDGVIDSLGVLRLIAYMEETFGVQVPHEDITLENFQSIRTLSNYVHQKRGLVAA